MDIEDFFYKIRKAENPFYLWLKRIARLIIYKNIPAPKFIFRPLYQALVLWRVIMPLILSKFIYVPIFKARCLKCGDNINIQNSIPWIEGNLDIEIGDYVVLDACIFTSGKTEERPLLQIGDNTILGHKTAVNVGRYVKIGNNCLIAPGVLITDNDGHPINPDRRVMLETVGKNEIKPIILEDNVWVGTRAIILKGVTIGTGSIVSAQSVVTRNIPPNSIVQGCPARIILRNIDKIGNIR
jgi:acetyltransferase-like isoleucine patch superfamily enzyme